MCVCLRVCIIVLPKTVLNTFFDSFFAISLLVNMKFIETDRTHTYIHTYMFTHFPQHIDESTAVYLWFGMEPIEAIWWIITCAVDELCNIRHKRSHAEKLHNHDENTWAQFHYIECVFALFIFPLVCAFFLSTKKTSF